MSPGIRINISELQFLVLPQFKSLHSPRKVSVKVKSETSPDFRLFKKVLGLSETFLPFLPLDTSPPTAADPTSYYLLPLDNKQGELLTDI